MSRYGRSRRARGAQPAEQRCLFGILTCPEDFERARPWRVTHCPDYDSYLLEIDILLASALAAGRPVHARMFHPDDYADFCLLHALDPAERRSRTRYLANPDLQTQLLPYCGEVLAGDYIPRLVRARDNGLTLRHVDLLLEDAPAAEVQRAHRRGADAFHRILVGAGGGFFRFTCGVEAPGAPLTAEVDLLYENRVIVVNDEDLDLVCAVLCAAGALRLPGRVVLEGHQGGDDPSRTPAAWGWDLRAGVLSPVRAPVLIDDVLVVPGFPLGVLR